MVLITVIRRCGSSADCRALWTIGFEADAFGHRLGKRTCGESVGSGDRAGSDRISTSPPSKRQTAEHAVGGETQAVAGGAEGGGHGADETDAAERVAGGEAIDIRRADAGLRCARSTGISSAQFVFDGLRATSVSGMKASAPRSWRRIRRRGRVRGSSPRAALAACSSAASPRGMYSMKRTVSRRSSVSRAKSANSSSLVPRMVTQLILSDVEAGFLGSDPGRAARSPDRRCG